MGNTILTVFILGCAVVAAVYAAAWILKQTALVISDICHWIWR